MSERFIWRDNQYHDGTGRVIFEREPIQGTPPDSFVRFRSIGTVEARNSNGQLIHKRDYVVQLPLASTLDEAFAQVDEASKKLKGPEIEKLKRELGVGGILKPSSEMTRKIIGGSNGGPRRRL